MKRKSYLVLLLALAAFLGLAATGECYNAIGEEDTLQISVWDHPELTVTVPVRPGGLVSVPFVGDVKAAGLSTQELKALLEKEFSAFIKTPTVSVVVTAVNSFKVYVLGAGILGAKPEASGVQSGTSSGAVTLKRDTTLIQLLSLLGFNKDADLKNAYLMRGEKKLGIDFYKLVIKGDASQNIQLEPNDVIFVPDNFEQRIRVIGAVKTPGIIPFSEGMTALDAVLSTGGFTDYASQNNVVVVRKEGDAVKNIRVKVKDVINGDIGKNLPLKPGDIVKVNSGIF